MSLPLIHSFIRRVGLACVPIVLTAVVLAPTSIERASAQNQGRRALTIRADIQQANSDTGVIYARGNVQLSYPARQIQATATQAQYFSRERRIVLSGNVYVLQEGNSLQADTITYYIDQGRFVALPQGNRQVESIVLVTDAKPSTLSPTSP
jgi:lipopolysaccharide export system protein LptA